MSDRDIDVLEQALSQARADWLRVMNSDAPRPTLDAADARLHEAMADYGAALGMPAPGGPPAALPATLTGHLFTSGSAAVAAAAAPVRHQVAVCLSGGGTRSASCSMGALRGLRTLGLLDRVQYLSTVSGGGWAGSLYTYAPFDDATLLGTPIPDADIGRLRWDSGQAPFNLAELHRHAIGHFCTQIGWDALIAGTYDLYWRYPKLPGHQYWPRLIGRYVLEPYGLGDQVDHDGVPTRYYSLTPGSFDLIVGKNNPGLSPDHFHFSRAGAPLWLANATFNAPGFQPKPYPLWLSQLDVGIYPSFPGAGIDGGVLGGGSIDPFTFRSTSPVRIDGGLFTVDTPQPFALSDPTGTSSAAFGVELFSRLPDVLKRVIQDITPEYPYWPVAKPDQPARCYDVSDGAGLDNQAICGLLGWAGADRILSFVNTDTPIVVNPSLPVTDSNGVQMDSTIPPLFGWTWDDYLGRYRLVTPADGNLWYLRAFPYGSFGDLIRGLRSSIKTGGAAVSKIVTDTVDNPRFGIKGSRRVQVLFVFNHLAPNFWRQLDNEIKVGLFLEYPLVTFPYFDTVRDLNLTRQAVNLLAAQVAWSVTTQAELVRSMFDPIS